MQVKPVVPAGDGQLEDIVDELKQIGDPVRHQVPLHFPLPLPPLDLALLDSEVVVLLLLHDDPQDDVLEVAKAASHVHLAQLLHGVLQLRILDVIVDQTFVGGDGFEGVEDLAALGPARIGVPGQLQMPPHLLMDDAQKIHDDSRWDGDLALESANHFDDERTDTINYLLDHVQLVVVPSGKNAAQHG